ncbi:LemA family protein [Candidatus Woesearchaeota archaeon]|nr:LemA family protein [Candidatus Woesearchaeota archaeon]
MVDATIIIIVVAVVVALYLILVYNGLIRIKNRVENAWAQIDVQLRRRYDLIPNLVSTVKGYAKHEKELLTQVTRERSNLVGGASMAKKAAASDAITGALKSLFAVAENYPDLKANQNFMQLQEELSGTESKIAYARQFYNDQVMLFNTKLQVFPTNVFGRMLGFSDKEMFETKGAARENVKVEF